jgi:hypothetical protein
VSFNHNFIHFFYETVMHISSSTVLLWILTKSPKTT